MNREKMSDIRELTIRKGFRYFEVNDKGQPLGKARTKSGGEKIKLDVNSIQFLSQRSKFEEWPLDKKVVKTPIVETPTTPQIEDGKFPESLDGIKLSDYSVEELKAWLDSLSIVYGEEDGKKDLKKLVEEALS
jgi:hypothetical protein